MHLRSSIPLPNELKAISTSQKATAPTLDSSPSAPAPPSRYLFYRDLLTFPHSSKALPATRPFKMRMIRRRLKLRMTLKVTKTWQMMLVCTSLEVTNIVRALTGCNDSAPHLFDSQAGRLETNLAGEDDDMGFAHRKLTERSRLPRGSVDISH